jgi:hypothetical protein
MSVLALAKTKQSVVSFLKDFHCLEMASLQSHQYMCNDADPRGKWWLARQSAAEGPRMLLEGGNEQLSFGMTAAIVIHVAEAYAG